MVAGNDYRESMVGRWIPIKTHLEPEAGKWLTFQQLVELLGEPPSVVAGLMDQRHADGARKLPQGMTVIVGMKPNGHPVWEKRWWKKTVLECAAKYRTKVGGAFERSKGDGQ